MNDLKCFKSYDIRGQIGVTLDNALAERIGRAFATVMAPRDVVVGHDCRTSSEGLADALIHGLQQQGVRVLDIGQAGSEEVYFATAHLGADAGIEVTASHNPSDYNGMKLVGADARPLTDAEFQAVRRATADGNFATHPLGQREKVETRSAYASRIASMVVGARLRPLKLLVNAGNGVAGPAFDAIMDTLPAAQIDVVRINHLPDGQFPNGIPNPLLPENQPQTAKAVIEHDADLGIAWDGDFDRCFFFDEAGAFVAGEYAVALLARAMLERHEGATIVHDHRVILNIRATIRAAGGFPQRARTGHAFMKTVMREHSAVYGGEMSAHHYFRDFMYCDSGMIPVLKMLELLSVTGRPLSSLVDEMRQAVASSGEINFPVDNAQSALDRICAHYASFPTERDDFDGLSLTFDDWRLNLRRSSTEPLLRLNIESAEGPAFVRAKLAEVQSVMRG